MTEEAPTLPTLETDSPPSVEHGPLGVLLEDHLRIALGEDYELGPQVGRGGMGIVYRAMDLRLKREVAIKVLPPEVTYRSDLRKRFVREAQVAASLTHPNIVPIYDVGNKGGLVWFVMSLVNGESARDLVRRSGPQPLHVVMRILQETAWALSYAHARGVVHRDIKPDNIMVERTSDRTIVTDFGLAKIRAEEGTELTSAGGIVGTPAYMSPEQARGAEEVDQKTDIYSLGLVGYFLLTGRNPFEGKGQQAVLARVLTEEAPRVSTARPDLPSWFVDVLAKATARDPARRHENAEALAAELDQGENPLPVPTSVENLLDLVESYGELSILGAWMLLIFGVPEMPTGGWVLFAALLCFPLMRAINLVSVEGLRWPDIRNGVVARRVHWLRTLSLRRQAGVNALPFIMIMLSVLGVVVIWFLQHYNFVTDTVMGFRTRIPKPIDMIPIRERPEWAFWYAILGSLAWARVFGLPRARRLSPWQLDTVSSWHMPVVIDWLGGFLFKQVSSVRGKIEATADFRQLSDPAVQSALAFNRTRRALSWSARWKLRAPVNEGCRLVKRLWYAYERVQKLNVKLKMIQPEGKKGEALAAAISKRENLLAECSTALDNLRMILEEGNSPVANFIPVDQRALEEARRLTAPMRAAMRGIKTYLIVLLLWIIVNLAAGATYSSRGLEFKPPDLGTTGMIIDGFFRITLPLFALFYIFKRRLYT